ncbi:hypothetical protein N7448_009639 [Penicillium atrosanguineum]|uniref:Uncharacterized protein n=1 Tax=Penicillium atrosanguineum TaxID=1132637 RepID=A0A9W9PZU6_9EURO|nr:uncharacterized protein N7443_006885 [Penicillium atrosanguineum]KAJ5123542.1 hypothetical protein N7448_009639 [Penicillium atrosanguineum]KAJ5142171.1 hypothetical protein N7526_003166 [Penicillium atrosanguineum]KAJ5298765.1 hypothetical protein N7443_006885 [Penicillium atrosanguineum]KAJ5320970.1 hypothetical protein N7476_003972 [Penicillium atrosanguineum]
MTFPFFLPDTSFPLTFPEARLIFSFISSILFCLPDLHLLRVMSKRLGEPNKGWATITPERFEELLEAQRATYAVLTDYLAERGRPLEDSIHAPPGIAPIRRAPRPARQRIVADCQDIFSFNSLSDGDNKRSASPSVSPGAGVNPLAPAFTPTSPAETFPEADNLEAKIRRGVRSPDEFMMLVRSLKKVNITVPPRRIVFGNLPKGTNISDVICLVFDGAIMRAWSVVDDQVIVEFCDDLACRRYYDANFPGIKVCGDHVITVEKPDDTEVLTDVQRLHIKNGVSRLVGINGITNHLFAPLCEVLKCYELDHTHLVECDKPGMIYVYFRNLAHASDFRTRLEEDSSRWGDCVVDYLPDPQVATRFHFNGASPRFYGAAIAPPGQPSTRASSFSA